MSNAVYKSDLDVFVDYPVPGQSKTKMDVLFYFVETFENGAGGKIDLRTTNDSTIAAEIERIRKQKTITIYINSKLELDPTSKIIDLAKSGIKNFTIVFRVKGYDKKTRKIVSVTAIIAEASFVETPIPVGGTPPSLKIKLNMSNIRANKYVGDELKVSARTFSQSRELIEA
jgi:hypothetical protein